MLSIWLWLVQKNEGNWYLEAACDEVHGTWQDKWLGEIKKTREMNREQLKSDRIYTCEKHFEPEDIEICKYKSVFSR